jgi:hypothetical protein
MSAPLKNNSQAVILTLFQANNIGAYLQAYSLMTALQQLGFDVNFGYWPSDTRSRNSMIGKIIGYIKAGDIRKFIWKAKNVSMYRQIQSTLPTINLQNHPTFDTAIVGSDEVWNISTGHFAHYPSYFGHDINAKLIIAYAPCGNGITAAEFQEISPNEKFSKFDALSARDIDTVKMAREISGRDVVRVVDPTMLIDSLHTKIIPCTEAEPFMLVYSYGLTKPMIKRVKQFAKEKNLKLISVGTYNSWCHKNIIANPWEFLGYLKDAAFVVTSTFHGTILSIKFNKQFICFAERTYKVLDALDFYNLKDRNVSNPDNLFKIANKQINYDQVNKTIELSRQKSLEYLTNALNLS